MPSRSRGPSPQSGGPCPPVARSRPTGRRRSSGRRRFVRLPMAAFAASGVLLYRHGVSCLQRDWRPAAPGPSAATAVPAPRGREAALCAGLLLWAGVCLPCVGAAQTASDTARPAVYAGRGADSGGPRHRRPGSRRPPRASRRLHQRAVRRGRDGGLLRGRRRAAVSQTLHVRVRGAAGGAWRHATDRRPGGPGHHRGAAHGRIHDRGRARGRGHQPVARPRRATRGLWPARRHVPRRPAGRRARVPGGREVVRPDAPRHRVHVCARDAARPDACIRFRRGRGLDSTSSIA